MKTGTIVLRAGYGLLILFSFVVQALGSGAPSIAAGQRIYCGDTAIDFGFTTAPTVCDWNNDGRVDLLVGQFDYGYINLLTNCSPSGVPKFMSSSLIQANGTPITMSYG